MKTTFLNQFIRGPIPTVFPGNQGLDGLGKFQYLDRLFVDVNKLYTTISDRFNQTIDRQQKEGKYLEEMLSGEMLTGLIGNWPTTSNGIIDTIPLWLGASPKLEWQEIKVYLVDKNLQVLPDKADYTIQENKILVNAEKAPYTLFHYKLPTSVNTSGFVINCNASTLVRVDAKDPTTGAWQEVPMGIGLIQKQDKSFYDASFSELKVIVKNVTVSNNYAIYFSADAIDGTKRNIRLPVSWNKNLPANSISINCFTQQGPVFFEGSLVFDGKSYNVQIPSWMFPASRLELVKYTSLSLNTYTILKCPYPVDLTSDIGIFKSLNDYQSSAVLDWEGSLDGISWTPAIDINTLSYSETYSEKPKYFFVRLKGFFETAFIYYGLNKSINSAWPITEDGKLFFNGSGLAIKNPTLSPVQISGNILFSESDSYNESIPFGSIGID